MRLELEADTTYLILFDSDLQEAFLRQLVQLKSLANKSEVVLIQMNCKFYYYFKPFALV
jgi:uncharacterized protein YrzB (UPF0473 family)